MTELRLERKLPADPKTVFDFVTKTKNLLKWWGPEGMHLPEHDIDFTQKGPWYSVMANAEGNRFKVSGEVVAVDTPKAVEFTWGWHDENDERGHESTVRFEIAEAGDGGSMFTLIHSGLADEESASNHNQGWTSSLSKLERMAS